MNDLHHFAKGTSVEARLRSKEPDLVLGFVELPGENLLLQQKAITTLIATNARGDCTDAGRVLCLKKVVRTLGNSKQMEKTSHSRSKGGKNLRELCQRHEQLWA
jgi:hypothetical protein